MNSEVIGGILIPFVGTTLGAAGVFFMKKRAERSGTAGTDRFCSGGDGGGFGMESSDSGDGSVRRDGTTGIHPAVVGFWIGNLFYWLWIISFLICTVTVKRRKDRRAGWRGRRCWCWR